MKIKTFTLLIFLFFSIGVLSQTYTRENPISVNSGCGIWGETDAEFGTIEKVMKNKSDSLLLSYISSDNIKLQLLSIIAISIISKERPLSITPKQFQTIATFKKRKDIVYVCSGCDGRYHESIKKIFSKRHSVCRETISWQLKFNLQRYMLLYHKPFKNLYFYRTSPLK